MVSFKLFVGILLLLLVSCVRTGSANGISSKKNRGSGINQSPSPITQHDIYGQLTDMKDLCEKVMDCVSEYEQQLTDGAEISEDSIPLLNQLRCNMMKTSCLTIVNVAEASENAALSQLADLAESL